MSTITAALTLIRRNISINCRLPIFDLKTTESLRAPAGDVFHLVFNRQSAITDRQFITPL
jgi:hypothetical protein